MNRWEDLADRLGIVEPHDERCQGGELCREHFIEKLREAGIDDRKIVYTTWPQTWRLVPDGRPQHIPSAKPICHVMIFGYRDGERVIVEWRRIGRKQQ